MSKRTPLLSQDSLFLAISTPAGTGASQSSFASIAEQDADHVPPAPGAPGEEVTLPSETQPLIAPTIVQPPAVPKDRYYLAQAIFFLIGIGMLFPWNVFITATAFFELKFFGSKFYDNFESWFSIAYNLANVLTLLFVMRIIERFSTSFRVYASLIPSVAIFIIITALVTVDINANTFFGFIMLCVVLSGVAVGFLQNGIFSLTAKFPFEYTAATMNGQGLAGLAVAMSQILTTLAGSSGGGEEDDEAAIELSAMLYFSVSILVLLLSIFGYVVLRRLPVFRYYHKGRRDRERAENGAHGGKEFVDSTWGAQLALYRRIWRPSFSVFFNFFVTLAIFPSVIASIAPVTEDSESRIFRDLFVPFAFLLFNVGDLGGRVLAGFVPRPRQALLPFISGTRAVFFFLFLCSNVVLRSPDGTIIDSSLPTFFANDYVYWAFVLLFALSNGWVASVCMMTGPSVVESREREKAGSLMIFSLVLGLCFGSFFSFGLRAILCQCNPFS